MTLYIFTMTPAPEDSSRNRSSFQVTSGRSRHCCAVFGDATVFRTYSGAQRPGSGPLRESNQGRASQRSLLLVLVLVGDGACDEQAGKIVRVYCVAQQKGIRHLEDFLHGAQIGGV